MGRVKPVDAKEVKESKPIRAFSLFRDEGGFRVAEYLIDGDEIVDFEVGEPDVYSLSVEKFRLKTSKYIQGL